MEIFLALSTIDEVLDAAARPGESEPKNVGSIHVQRVAAITEEESVTISIVAHPNGPTVTTRGLPDTGSQLDAIPHSLYHISLPDIPLRPGVAARTATGNAITCVGSFAATVYWLTGCPARSPPSYTCWKTYNSRYSAQRLREN
jgi:hypothetical protein